MSDTIAKALVDFNETVVLETITSRLDKGEDPMVIIRELQDGMGLIGERFNTGEFFLSELLMSADLFTRAMEILEPKLEGTVIDTIGKLVIGTPKGDLHDIGKNIFCTVAKAAGFEIHDMDQVNERGLRDSLKVIVGGGVVNETVMNFIGADAYTTDAMDGLKKCEGFIKS
ncbi:MAG: B12-binding domain-containing protein [Deltaproteobacteria bacterium]|nr:B12-binding domain-containing protein [Deltaproteobacteria bacterium]